MIECDKWLTANAARLGVDPANVNPHSVDLRLGGKIICQRLMPSGKVDRWELSLQEGDEVLFVPGVFYLAETLERVHVPETHRGQLLLKSSTARKGLNHLMAGYADAGWEGVLTLEFVAYIPAIFTIGQRIMQIEFARLTESPAKPYSVTGRYHGAQGVQEAQPERV